MKFGPIALDGAAGSIAAHTLRLPATTIKKGTILTAGDIADLAAAGVSEVVAARAEPGDLLEDQAAERLAKAVTGGNLAGRGAKTGRVNLYAELAGVVVLDRDRIDRLNRLDPALTIATLPPFAPVAASEMVATIKIIPFAAPVAAIEAAEELCRADKPLRVEPFRLKQVGMIATVMPKIRSNVLNKTRRVLDERLDPAGAAVSQEIRIPHEAAAVAAALRQLAAGPSEMFIVFGASAVTDPADVIPAGIEQAGGKVFQVGIPVDPGNLLVLGELDARPVIGAPGCARSPRENGFDWVLQRLLAGLPVTRSDLTAMGVGGLLKEIASRKEPRERADIEAE